MSDESGWIPWAGGECPVAGEQEVVIRVRQEPSTLLRLAKNCRWEHGEERNNFYSGRDIIAYRLSRQEDAHTEARPIPQSKTQAKRFAAQTEDRPTPETDALLAAYIERGLDDEFRDVLLDLARKLERERDDLKHDIEQYVDMNSALVADVFKAEQRAETAERQLAEARAKEREYDFLLGKMVHQRSGPNVGWTLDILLPGDAPREAINAALTDEGQG